MRIIEFKELKPEKGIPYCRDHLRRKCEAGEFPQPIPLSGRRVGWLEDEIDAWIQARAAEREPKPPHEVAGASEQQPHR